jgi:hypothetical protein
MSWNVTAKGRVDKLRARVANELGPMLKEDPHGEYHHAKIALDAALAPLPADQICSLESFGSLCSWKQGDEKKFSFQIKFPCKAWISYRR